MKILVLLLIASLALSRSPSYAARDDAGVISITNPVKGAGDLKRSEAALKTLVSAYQREDITSFMDMVSYELYGIYGTYPDLRDVVQVVFDRYEAIAVTTSINKSTIEGDQVVITVKWTMTRVDTFNGLLENNEGFTDLVFINGEDGTRLIDITGDRLW